MIDTTTPPKGAPAGSYFDEAAASRVVNFFQRYLILPQTGEPFLLQPWQRDMLRHVFGWMRPDGTRLVRTLYNEIGKKAGKGALASGIAIYMTCADGEKAGLVVSAAVDTGQASLVFGNAKIMVEKSPKLANIIGPYKWTLLHRKSNSTYRVLSSAAESKEGLDVSCCIFDEIAKHKTPDLWRVLRGSTIARKQPLTVVMTNAGHDRTSVGWEVHEYACRVRDGKQIDPSFFPVIYAAPDDVKLDTDEEIIAAGRLANPSLGVTIKELDFVAQAREAIAQGPAALNDFKRKCLGHWNQLATAYVPMPAWDECGKLPLDLDKLVGCPAYACLDLSSTVDLTSLNLVFPHDDGTRSTLAWHWMPRANVVEAEKRDRQPYRNWTEQGYGPTHHYLELTEGSAIDYGTILRRVVEIDKLYPFVGRQVGFDERCSWSFGQELQAKGFDPIAITQRAEGMNDPTRELYRLIVNRELRHGANPLLDWQASILEVREWEGLIRPVKGQGPARKRIDGMVALIMSIGRAIVGEHTATTAPSVYETGGVFTL